MATYVIGDVQGCFNELQSLLQHIQFDPTQDVLWFTGDLVNRGLQSLETLRFVKNLPQKKVVLGNHDLTLLALAYTDISFGHTMQDILSASDRDDLLTWLRNQPLTHYDTKTEFLLVHAGLVPQWTVKDAIKYGREVEAALQSSQFREFLIRMYGNQPSYWRNELTGYDRLRFITNTLTRIRFCDLKGNLDLGFKGEIGSQPTELFPWFKIPNRAHKSSKIVFGHWAALNGECDEPNLFPIDTGCVWGRKLTALRLNDQKLFYVSCERVNTKKV